ncbi:putative glutamate--ammonia ligase [Nocardia nova SH22a]|uniref:Putative glutamate--ammonia ligase n=1 Tax=Nocardia nova SH22a TaxID=1415166 RepID=W5TFP2_9NOCA|nr:glutamine synthetase family protein [Nocardia nova]AHH17818.1 putative glutamate--ammonia ligase [Nocardia nova SH22a]
MMDSTEQQRRYRAERAGTIGAELSARDIVAVAVTWVDTSGITRVKAVPVQRLPHVAAWGVGASPVFDAFLLDDSILTEHFAGGPTGDLRLYPDLDRVTVLAALPGWAWAPADRYTQSRTPHPRDSRLLLRRLTGEFGADGWTLRTAIEFEWNVSRPDPADPDRFRPATAAPAYGMARLGALSGYLRDVLSTLRDSGVSVEQIHPEYEQSQFELAVAASDPVRTADTAVLVRETIRAAGTAHGLRTVFGPMADADVVGNGGHVHVSLWHDGINQMSGGSGPFGITEAGQGFAAGILEHLPGLLALGCPSVASYLRLRPSRWAGAYRCWGLENREAALRYVGGSVGEHAQAANFEVKAFDSAANPYLALAGLVAAGRAGVRAGATLPEPVAVDPDRLGPETRSERGIEPLPGTLAEAVAAFESDEVLGTAFGAELVDTIAAVRRGEIALFADATPEQITAASRWRY